MKILNQKPTYKEYSMYLIFMLIACSGAVVWQYIFPEWGGMFTSWGNATGWQREIALWNIGIISVIFLSLMKKNIEYMKILVIQSTILCLVLGINHLVSFIQKPSLFYIIHIAGIIEVLFLGGIWGSLLVYRTKVNVK